MKFKSESEFISMVRKMAQRHAQGLVHGIGDDAAVIRALPGKRWCITTDLLLEGIHFDLRYDSPFSVGQKSLAAGLSDLASMGANPRFVLVSVAVPIRRAKEFLAPFLRGMLKMADRHGVTLIGGDTSRAQQKIFIDVIVMGSVPAGREILRHGARKGDFIYVTGTLGKAALGLEVLKRRNVVMNRAEKRAVASHRTPIPRCSVGARLGKRLLATAMIDVSDGLSTDLFHLCEESRVGARIFEAQIPLPGVRDPCTELKWALSGGEDYELLFTVSPRAAQSLKSSIEGVPIHRIGVIVPRKDGVKMMARNGKTQSLFATGWDHFRRV
jgi:thiamine-monophosphate kinase